MNWSARTHHPGRLGDPRRARPERRRAGGAGDVPRPAEAVPERDARSVGRGGRPAGRPDGQLRGRAHQPRRRPGRLPGPHADRQEHPRARPGDAPGAARRVRSLRRLVDARAAPDRPALGRRRPQPPGSTCTRSSRWPRRAACRACSCTSSPTDATRRRPADAATWRRSKPRSPRLASAASRRSRAATGRWIATSAGSGPSSPTTRSSTAKARRRRRRAR